jgi:hypothetical protein
MEKEEEKIIDQNTEPAVDDNVEVLNPEEETLAQTDEVIPAPEDDGTFPMGTVEPVNPEIPIDTIPASTSIPLTVDEMPEEEPVVEDPVVDPSSVEVAPDAPIEEPIASDVVPEMGDESPADVAIPGECPNCEGEGCPVCDGNSIANLFGTMQEAVTIIWKYHLKTRKYSVHIALNDFYDKMLDLVDDVIEQYQGIHGIIEDVFTNCVCDNGTSEYDYLNNLRAYIENNKGLAGTESEIQSAFDDILGLIDTTLYKINNLTESKVKSYEEYVYEDYVNECGGHCKHCKNKEDEDLFVAEEEEEEE